MDVQVFAGTLTTVSKAEEMNACEASYQFRITEQLLYPVGENTVRGRRRRERRAAVRDRARARSPPPTWRVVLSWSGC
jgi:hypothetical protein